VNKRTTGSWLLASVCLAGIAVVQPASAQTEPDCAFLFEHIDYGGSELFVGALQEIRSFGDFNDLMSSIYVDHGCYCRLFEHSDFEGEEKIFDARQAAIDISFIEDEWNDRASSIACMRVAQP
jgi:hypothetical protein